jgi:hypothetical protein
MLLNSLKLGIIFIMKSTKKKRSPNLTITSALKMDAVCFSEMLVSTGSLDGSTTQKINTDFFTAKKPSNLVQTTICTIQYGGNRVTALEKPSAVLPIHHFGML